MAKFTMDFRKEAVSEVKSLYRPLLQLYDIDQSTYLNEYDKRLNGYATVKLPFIYREESSDHENQYFYVNHQKLDFLHDQILRQSREIQVIYKGLSNFAQSYYLRSKLIDEVTSTLAMENIPSSPTDLLQAVRDAKEHGTEPKHSEQWRLVQIYYQLISENYSIQEIDDIRNIAEIYRNLTGLPLIHPQELDMNNERILEMKRYLQEYPSPMLYKIVVAHYYAAQSQLNARGSSFISRYMSSRFLVHELDDLSAITLSSSFRERQAEYNQCMEDCADIRSRGELTSFCEMFFETINHQQQALLSDLKLKQSQLKVLNNLVSYVKGEDSQAVIRTLGQHYIFQNGGNGMSQKELVDELQRSPYYIRKAIEELMELRWIVIVKRKPLELMLSHEICKEIKKGGMDESHRIG